MCISQNFKLSLNIFFLYQSIIILLTHHIYHTTLFFLKICNECMSVYEIISILIFDVLLMDFQSTSYQLQSQLTKPYLTSKVLKIPNRNAEEREKEI